MKLKTIIYFFLAVCFLFAIFSVDGLGAAFVAVCLTALFGWLGWRSMKKPIANKQHPQTPVTNNTNASGSGSSTIRTKVVGVTFKNDDGTDRQEILATVYAGDALDLEPYEYNGAPAMAVIHANGCIGNIKADLAADLCSNPYITYTAEVLEVTGGDGIKSYGCNIEITEI